MTDALSVWDVLRAHLRPCPDCGEAKDLLFKCAQMCATAHVYCGRCGAGTPADKAPVERFIVYGDPGTDSRPAAVAKWNAIERIEWNARQGAAGKSRRRR